MKKVFNPTSFRRTFGHYNNGLLVRRIALTAQDGKLSLGEVPLLSLPSVLPGR